MFKTNVRAEVLNHGLFGDAIRRWWWVEHGGLPWFHAVLESHDGESVHHRYVMLANWELLAATVEGKAEREWLSSVSAATPPWLNGSSQWRLDPLERAEVLETEEGRVILALTIDGTVYYDQTFEPINDPLRSARIIYGIEMLGARFK